MASSGVYAQGKAAAYTTWDDNYFYAAFSVDDPDIAGTNSALHSNPWEDDAVEIFIETDNNHNPGRPVKTFHMAVSAAGGSAFTAGTEEGTWARKPIITFKYATSADGSLNNPEDQDLGYMIEMALPWFELGVKPPSHGTMMSFNVVIRMKGETNRFISLSPEVKTEEDVHDASKWANIVFTGPAFGAATLSLDKIVSARYVARVPLIDGQIRLKEWNKNTSFELPLPMEILNRPKHQLQKMMLTYYFYWYQADPRKAAPFSRVRDEDGKSQLTSHPIRSAGPWFSYDRVQWHKDELADIRRAGIDIILPVYRGDAANRAGFASKGLDCMVEALRELKSEKKPYPLVGLFFDTSSMSATYGSNPDLKNDEVKRTFYGMIREFFMRVPEEFRAQVQMAEERADRPCYIVDLYTSNWFSDFDSSFIAYVNERFKRDFNANILWIGAKDYREKAPGFDAYCNYGAGLGFGYDDTARIRIAAVGSGYDDCAVAGRTTPIRSRDAGDTYRTDWSKALDKRPNWVMVDGWNAFHEGSDICGSREYGFTFVDSTALQALKFRSARDYDAKYLRHSLPSVILPNAFYQVDVMIRNDGMKPWRVAEGYALAYKWYQDGRQVGDSGIKRPLQQDVLPGHASNITIGVAAVKQGDSDLPEGNYEIRFEMVRLDDGKWFSALGDEAFTVPVRIGNPSDNRVTYLSVDGPTMVRTATAYPFKIRVRNDGTTTWKAGVAEVGCQLFKVSSYVHGASEDLNEEVQITPVRAALAKDVEPGEIADAELVINLKDAAGRAIPVWNQSDPWAYQLRFDVWDGSHWLSDIGTRTYERVIGVFEADYGVNIVASDISDTIDAGKTYTAKLVVKNNGPDAWTPDKHSFGYHWYYLDGTEAVWEGEKTAIKAKIQPGEPAIIMAKVTAPQYDGRYILAWDFAEGGKWASIGPLSRGGDMLTSEVTVTNGKLVFADLTKVFDTVASSPDRNRESGNFDGSVKSFPTEFMPPDASIGRPNDIYPCGYFWSVKGNGLESSRRISFNYGGKSAGEKNAITCAGQIVQVPKARYAKIHVVAAAIEPDQEAEFGIGYLSSIETAKLTMSSWAAEPAHGEDAALVTLHRHSATRDERGYKCFLFHYAIPVDPSRPVTSIVLPKNDKVRVVAVTLEKA